MHDKFDYYEHPIFNPYEFLINTPPMRRLKNVLDGWLWTGVTGGIIRGEARCGKTTAATQLANRLKTRGGKIIPTHYFSVPARDRRTIHALYRALTVSANLPLKTNSQIEPMFSNLVHFFLEHCIENETKQFVLLVDEAQRLSLNQYNVFAEFHDFIREKLKILFTVIFIVNSDEAEIVFSNVSESRYRHIYGRFFKKITDFYGVQSESDVKNCLKQYDTLRFPRGTGPTYTEFFLPEIVRKGWRYSSLSSVIWSVFHEFQKDYHLTSWGMESFVCTVNVLLYDFFPKFGPDQCNQDMVRAAIDVSGLTPSMVKSCS
ncbi:ATP-binding protein [Microbulbifer epialgicus]|uniref:ATP-binding protein n=1 Tax=Microbulbifer epialgicus TaxID=393907 RepID=A0ABV4P475_9GAMM